MSPYEIEDFLFFDVIFKIHIKGLKILKTFLLIHKLKLVWIYVFSIDLEGYVVGLLTCTSQGNNEFFDVKFKTSEMETKTICIMKHTNVDVKVFF